MGKWKSPTECDSPTVNVWCAISQDRIIGPFLFAEGTIITTTTYHAMLELFTVSSNWEWQLHLSTGQICSKCPKPKVFSHADSEGNEKHGHHAI